MNKTVSMILTILGFSLPYISAMSYAQTPAQLASTVPVLAGSRLEVKSALLEKVPNADRVNLVANVTYLGGCTSPQSFVVVGDESSHVFQVFQTLTPAKGGRAQCRMVTQVSAKITVYTYPTSPTGGESITVNEVKVKPLL